MTQRRQQNAPASATLAGALRLRGGFAARDRERVLDRLGPLDGPLGRYRADGTAVVAGVKDRETSQQQVTLEVDTPGYPRLVAHSSLTDLDAALTEARRDMERALNEAKDRREPSVHRGR